jgi:tRNA U34 2-thiouridine synthase MnmA/TrmU
LRKVLLPIGHMMKSEVKAIAAARLPGLRVLSKHESMGICFIGKRDMKDFLDEYITMTPGRYPTLCLSYVF